MRHQVIYCCNITYQAYTNISLDQCVFRGKKPLLPNENAAHILNVNNCTMHTYFTGTTYLNLAWF